MKKADRKLLAKENIALDKSSISSLAASELLSETIIIKLLNANVTHRYYVNSDQNLLKK